MRDRSCIIPDALNPSDHPNPEIHCVGGGPSLWRGTFEAMASPCEVLAEGLTQPQFEALMKAVVVEAWRIEYKYSRYREDNIMAKINRGRGIPVSVDDETMALLHFADQCYQLSDGLFDVTSGVLRRVWRFDGSDNVPDDDQIDALLPLIGWPRIKIDGDSVLVPDGMELDLGGIGKEYAVDKSMHVARSVLAEMDAGTVSFLLNYGGDLACSGPRLCGRPWVVGVESAEGKGKPVAMVSLAGGGVATSGDSRRFLIRDGVRYSHILNPRTGRSVAGAPRSVSVASPTCLYAGILSTLALLHGDQAEVFLKAQEVPYWIVWND